MLGKKRMYQRSVFDESARGRRLLTDRAFPIVLLLLFAMGESVTADEQAEAASDVVITHGVVADSRGEFTHDSLIGEDGSVFAPAVSGETRRSVRAAPAGVAGIGGGGPHVAIVASAAGDVEDALFTDVQDKLLASGFFEAVTVINAGLETPSVGTLSAYDGILVWTNFDLDDTDQLGDNLAQYVDNGGGVVVAVFANTSDITQRKLGGRWDVEDYDVIEAGLGSVAGSATLGIVSIPDHPLVNGVSSFDGGALSSRPTVGSLLPGATLVASWSDGSPLVALRSDLPGNRVDLGMYPPSSDVSSIFWDSSTDGDALLANALLFVTGQDAIDVSLIPVALSAPSGLEETLDPTTLPGQVCLEGDLPPAFVVELWVSDVGVVNSGITGFYADVNYDLSVISADLLDHGALFPILQEGTIVGGAGTVINFGGTNFDAQGIEPNWARLGTVSFTTVGAGPVTIQTDLGIGGVGVFGRPPPPIEEIALGSVTIDFGDEQACCLPDGSCDGIDGDCCLAVGGTPLGEGTFCQETGACCYDVGGDSTCAELDPECCAALGGLFHGAGTTCGPVGACCFGIIGGACFETQEACCADFAGEFIGGGTVCLGDSDMNGIDDVCEGGCPVAQAPLVYSESATSCDGDGDCANTAICTQGMCYVPRNKYLSFLPGNLGQSVAYRVTLVASDLFPGSVGERWWVVPQDAAGDEAPARLSCTPEFAVWDDFEVVHVADASVVGDAIYEVQAIEAGCDVDDAASYSGSLSLSTVGLWGDVSGSAVKGVPQPPDGATNFVDIQFCVLGFQMSPSAPPVSWLDIDPDAPTGIINLADAFRVVVAFQGGGYPYAGPVGCSQ